MLEEVPAVIHIPIILVSRSDRSAGDQFSVRIGEDDDAVDDEAAPVRLDVIKAKRRSDGSRGLVEWRTTVDSGL